MTRDDIIRMAREAGMRVAGPMDSIDPRNLYFHELERFATLVAAHERNECAKVCENMALEWKDQPNIAQAERATMLECAATILARWRA